MIFGAKLRISVEITKKKTKKNYHPTNWPDGNSYFISKLSFALTAYFS